jgi:hypothetical protein
MYLRLVDLSLYAFLSSRTHISPNQEHSSGSSRARAEGASCGGASPMVGLQVVEDLFHFIFGLVEGIQDPLASSSFCIFIFLHLRGSWGRLGYASLTVACRHKLVLVSIPLYSMLVILLASEPLSSRLVGSYLKLDHATEVFVFFGRWRMKIVGEVHFLISWCRREDLCLFFYESPNATMEKRTFKFPYILCIA